MTRISRGSTKKWHLFILFRHSLTVFSRKLYFKEFLQRLFGSTCFFFLPSSLTANASGCPPKQTVNKSRTWRLASFYCWWAWTNDSTDISSLILAHIGRRRALVPLPLPVTESSEYHILQKRLLCHSNVWLTSPLANIAANTVSTWKKTFGH